MNWTGPKIWATITHNHELKISKNMSQIHELNWTELNGNDRRSRSFFPISGLLPLFQANWVIPSGRLPSVLNKPGGSVRAGILAWTSALFTKSLISLCLECLPTCFLHAKPWSPDFSTITPQIHWCGWHMFEPRRRLHAIFRAVGSKCNPNDGIGRAWTQSLALSDDTARCLALSTSDCAWWKSFSNLKSK